MSEGAEPTLQGGHRCVATIPLCRNDYKNLLSLLAMTTMTMMMMMTTTMVLLMMMITTFATCDSNYKSLLSLLATFASRLLLSCRLRATIVGLDKKGTRCHYLTLFKCNADGDDNEQVTLFEIVQV